MPSPWQGSAGHRSKVPRGPASADTQYHVHRALLAKEAVRTPPLKGVTENQQHSLTDHRSLARPESGH